jgi:CubicO group peptidase (beta-lactamase class C family)
VNSLLKSVKVAALLMVFGGFVPTVSNALPAAAIRAADPLAPTPVVAGVAAPPAVPGERPLTAEDVAAYFDGLVPDAISRADIAGAVVVVVKDGRPLFERGYGVSDVKTRHPVEADKTLFRPGSISKTFTWTAVMQLVESGKIDLDADVNQYLDFKIPPAFGKPITMRELMTHSEGFSDAAKDLIVTDPKAFKSLEVIMKSAVPARIFPPGTTPAYSNYGASLAGYIVQRVSGQPFADYVAQHIFAPLGMTESTFQQPLPSGWSANLSNGYSVASKPPGAFEFVNLAPAGSLSTTGADMARFMIAHLQNGEYQGRAILGAKTAELMHSPQFRPVPSLPAMALGFYEEPGNGHRVIGHAGDLNLFHSDLHLFLDDHVGLFVSFNSAGSAGASHAIRASIFKGFTDRYFPAAPSPALPTWKDAAADGKTLSGLYVESRRSDSGWLRIASYLLGQTKIVADKTGIVTISSFRGLNGRPKHWREVGPFQYREVGGAGEAAAVVQDGKVVAIMTDDIPPVEALQPVSAAMSSAWNLPLLYLALVVIITAVVTWPLAALIRRRYGRAFPLSGRTAVLYRLTRLVCVVDLIFFVSWLMFLSRAESDLQGLSSANDWILRIIQLIGVVGVIGVIAPLANAAVIFTQPGRSWWAKVSSTFIAIACLATVWFVISLRLITLHIAY